MTELQREWRRTLIEVIESIGDKRVAAELGIDQAYLSHAKSGDGRHQLKAMHVVDLAMLELHVLGTRRIVNALAVPCGLVAVPVEPVDVGEHMFCLTSALAELAGPAVVRLIQARTAELVGERRALGLGPRKEPRRIEPPAVVERVVASKK